MAEHLKIGDSYIDKHGNTTTVRAIINNYVSNDYKTWERIAEVTKVIPSVRDNILELNEASSKLDHTKETIYVVNSSGRKGTFIGMYHNKIYVLRMSDTFAYEEYDKSNLTEATTEYTFDVKFLNNPTMTYSYKGDKGSVAVGDYLMQNNTLAVVTAIDTNSLKATKRFNGVKFHTSKLM